MFIGSSTINVWNELLSTAILSQISQWRYEYKQAMLNKKHAAQERRHGNYGRGNNNGHDDSGNGNGKLLVQYMELINNGKLIKMICVMSICNYYVAA